MVKNIRHTGIVVTDVEQSLFFYEHLLGFKIKVDQLETGNFVSTILGLEDVVVRTIKLSLQADIVNPIQDSMIELLHFKSYNVQNEHTSTNIQHSFKKLYNIGITHIALTVKDIDSLYQQIKNAGFSFYSSPQTSPNGQAKVAFCKGPDGEYLELVQELIS